jgi:hypothetical protein
MELIPETGRLVFLVFVLTAFFSSLPPSSFHRKKLRIPFRLVVNSCFSAAAFFVRGRAIVHKEERSGGFESERRARSRSSLPLLAFFIDMSPSCPTER